MSRQSKDIARRLRFDHRPRRDAFRRWYFAAGLAACAVGAGLWVALTGSDGERQYLPGPVTPAHATFGDRCAHCHVSFASVPDARCETCHTAGPHAAGQLGAPACTGCHTEHRGAARLVGGTDQPCIACHAALTATHALTVSASIADLAGHPEFRALRDGARDPARLRFNHALHLTSTDVLEPLACAHCHVVDDAGRRMAPIQFATHCRRCHELKVKEAPAPIGDVEAPHDSPAAVREGLRDALAVLGVTRSKELFEGGNTGVLIPGQAERGPVDASRSLQEFQRTWVAKLEAALYAPFHDESPLLQNNKYCFLCHEQGEARAPSELPDVLPSQVPARWLAYAEFSHAAHGKGECAACHPASSQSSATSDVTLPSLSVCKQCHADGRAQSAGTACTLCHVYHHPAPTPGADATPAPTPTPVGLERLLGGGN